MGVLYDLGHEMFRAAGHCFFDFRVIHRERMIEDGPAVIASNHVSYFDPLIVGTGYRNPISFLGRRSLFRGIGAWLLPRVNCLPIERDGSDVGGLKTVIRELKAGRRILLFPEGTRSADGTLKPGEPGIGFIILKAGVPVQPVRIFGAYEALPRGARLPRLAGIRLVVGRPLHFSDSGGPGKSRETYQEISDSVMLEIAALEIPGDL